MFRYLLTSSCALCHKLARVCKHEIQGALALVFIGWTFWRLMMLYLSLVWCPSFACYLGGSYLWSATLGDDSWLMWWRLWGDLGGWWCCATLIDDLELWLMEVWLGWCLGWWRFWYVDDLETVIFYILPASWSLPPLRVGFLKTSLGWI